jgi:hypothetical protein
MPEAWSECENSLISPRELVCLSLTLVLRYMPL